MGRLPYFLTIFLKIIYLSPIAVELGKENVFLLFILKVFLSVKVYCSELCSKTYSFIFLYSIDMCQD